MITPLKKHPGQHAGVLALVVLVATTAVVMLAHRAPPAPPPAPPPRPASSVPVPSEPAEPPAPPVAVTTAITGTTTYDESRTSHNAAPVAGWLKKTRAKSLGRTVRAGETLAVIYSPEVYLTTASVVDQLRDYHGQASLDAERWRLLRWGMRREQLARIEAARAPDAALPLIARVSGIVVAETGSPAQLVDPSAGELFTITDPTYVWVYADVPEARAATLAAGMPAQITIEGVAPVKAKIAYVSRRAEDGMRKVRLEIHSAKPLVPPNVPVTVQLAP